MSITTPHETSAPAGERAARRQVGGLRILGTRTLHLLAEIRYRQFPKSHITVGRAEERDIRIRDPSLSRHHCTIVRTDDGGYALADARFRRVFHAPIAIGMQVRLGRVVLIVTDALGKCPILADRGSEFCRQAVAVYGSRRAAARATGLPRRILDRLVRAAQEGSR